MSEKKENKGVSAETAAALSATNPRPMTGSGFSAAIADAPAHERPKTIDQIRAGRRWRISVGHEPMTPEAEVFMFFERVEQLIRAAKLREQRKPYHTHLMKSALRADIYLKSAYEALEKLRTQ